MDEAKFFSQVESLAHLVKGSHPRCANQVGRLRVRFAAHRALHWSGRVQGGRARHVQGGGVAEFSGFRVHSRKLTWSLRMGPGHTSSVSSTDQWFSVSMCVSFRA